METGRKRRRIDASVKAKVALAAIRGEQTSAQICSAHSVHATQVTQWKNQAIAALPEVFARSGHTSETADDKLVPSLYEEIGRLKVELGWLKKRL